jgi:hypothetical protein
MSNSYKLPTVDDLNKSVDRKVYPPVVMIPKQKEERDVSLLTNTVFKSGLNFYVWTMNPNTSELTIDELSEDTLYQFYIIEENSLDEISIEGSYTYIEIMDFMSSISTFKPSDTITK